MVCDTLILVQLFGGQGRLVLGRNLCLQVTDMLLRKGSSLQGLQVIQKFRHNEEDQEGTEEHEKSNERDSVQGNAEELSFQHYIMARR